jgi:DNA-directed RNA polymerase subunit beta
MFVEVPKPKAALPAKPGADAKASEAKKEVLREEFTEVLAAFMIGEKFPLDVVNSQTGEIIIPANRRITKTLLRKVASAPDHIRIDLSPLCNRFREVVAQFESRFAELSEQQGII